MADTAGEPRTKRNMSTFYWLAGAVCVGLALAAWWFSTHPNG